MLNEENIWDNGGGADPELPVGYSKTVPFSVPEGYFNQLSDEITKTIEIEAFEEQFKFCAMPLEVPSGYFDSLPQSMLLAAKQADASAKTARLISFKGFRSWAVAASVVLVATISGGIYWSQSNKNPERILSKVGEPEIVEYVESTYGLDTKNMLNSEAIVGFNFESKEIVQYLNETGWE